MEVAIEDSLFEFRLVEFCPLRTTANQTLMEVPHRIEKSHHNGECNFHPGIGKFLVGVDRSSPASSGLRELSACEHGLKGSSSAGVQRKQPPDMLAGLPPDNMLIAIGVPHCSAGRLRAATADSAWNQFVLHRSSLESNPADPGLRCTHTRNIQTVPKLSLIRSAIKRFTVVGGRKWSQAETKPRKPAAIDDSPLWKHLCRRKLGL